MAENINFIPASELPVAEGDEVSVLCLEAGELKQKPAKGLGGGAVEPDMVITISGSINPSTVASQCAITQGSVFAIATKLQAGEVPIVKVRHIQGVYGDYSHYLNEFDAAVTTYGESFWVAALLADANGPVLYKFGIGINSDGSFGWAGCNII